MASLDDTSVSLPSDSSQSTATWRRFLVVPKPINQPSTRPWSTLIATIVVVVGIGSLLLFGSPNLNWLSGQSGAPSGPAVEPKKQGEPAGTTATGSPQKGLEPVPAATGSKQLTAALSDPGRLVVQPGTPLRNLSDAIDAAQSGQVIEVASNDMFRGEIRVPPKSLTIVANPEFHPAFYNTIRINGGGSIRIEGFHFEPYLANKPAIEVEKMPERLEIVGCTFRGSDGVLIVFSPASVPTGTRPQVLLERLFAAGNIILGLAGLPPDLRVTNCCLVADQTLADWQLSAGDLGAPAVCDIALQNNTLVGRYMFHVRLDDQKRPIHHLPRTTIRIEDNIFVFPRRFPCTFFRWEAWQRPDIVTERFAWSGANNAFSGLGAWSMATTMVLSDPAATPQVAMETPEEWQSRWATQVTNSFKGPPEFRYAGPPKKTKELTPFDFDLTPQSKQREMGSNQRPLGADTSTLPTPPSVP